MISISKATLVLKQRPGGNSEMAYFSGEKIVLKKCKHHFEILLDFQSRDQMPKTIKTLQPPIYHFLSATKACYKADFWMLALGVQKRINNIHHFHIHHNAPCLPPKFCITLPSISLG